MTDPKEGFEFACMDDSPHNNGFWNDENRGPYYGRVSTNSDEIDEPDENEDWPEQNHHEGL